MRGRLGGRGESGSRKFEFGFFQCRADDFICQPEPRIKHGNLPPRGVVQVLAHGLEIRIAAQRAGGEKILKQRMLEFDPSAFAFHQQVIAAR